MMLLYVKIIHKFFREKQFNRCSITLEKNAAEKICTNNHVQGP